MEFTKEAATAALEGLDKMIDKTKDAEGLQQIITASLYIEVARRHAPHQGDEEVPEL